MVKGGARSEKRREIRGCSDQVRGDPRAAPLARARDCAIDCPSHPSGPAAPRPIAVFIGPPPPLAAACLFCVLVVWGDRSRAAALNALKSQIRSPPT